MNAKWSRRIAILLIASFVYALACGLIWNTAKADVLANFAPDSNAGSTLDLESVHLSASHGMYLTCQVNVHSQLNTAHWRLWPFREVVLSK